LIAKLIVSGNTKLPATKRLPSFGRVKLTLKVLLLVSMTLLDNGRKKGES
jgi:hypothetical protein